MDQGPPLDEIERDEPNLAQRNWNKYMIGLKDYIKSVLPLKLLSPMHTLSYSQKYWLFKKKFEVT